MWGDHASTTQVSFREIGSVVVPEYAGVGIDEPEEPSKSLFVPGSCERCENGASQGDRRLASSTDSCPLQSIYQPSPPDRDRQNN